MSAEHVPVMLSRVVDLLVPALARHTGTPPVVVDGTLGLGGHARALLAACPTARLVGVDRDEAALEIAGRRLADFAGRTTLVRSTYDRIPAILEELGVADAQAVLLDVGLSSLQIDDLDRGFSYSRDVQLDMRMDRSSGRTAADLVNEASAADLAQILRHYGDERFAKRIAAGIVARREREPITTTGALVEVIDQSVPAAARRATGHPAKRTFQALRIKVNDELRLLADALPAAISVLSPRGRVAVLAYHSGEDRLVKRVLAHAASDRTPLGLPVSLPPSGPQLRLLTRGAERPSDEEKTTNPRAASARLRAAERVDGIATDSPSEAA